MNSVSGYRIRRSSLLILAPIQAGGHVTFLLNVSGMLASMACGLPYAIVDQLEPLVPPKIKSEEAEKLSEALKRGEPNREEIAAGKTVNIYLKLVSFRTKTIRFAFIFLYYSSMVVLVISLFI